MKLDIMDSITLDNNDKYMVISKANYNGQEYYCLFNDNQKVMFGYIINNMFNEIKDNELNKKLLSLFDEEIKKFSN